MSLKQQHEWGYHAVLSGTHGAIVTKFQSRTRVPDAVNPDIQCVRTHWNRGFITFRRVRHARTVVLMMLV